MKRPLPKPTTDAEADAFVETADLTRYDLLAMTPMPSRKPVKRPRARRNA
ncbi:MAG: hypothetical protein ACOYNL_09290 [Rickettsiales bacterium]